MKHSIQDQVCNVIFEGDVVSTTVQSLRRVFVELFPKFEGIKDLVLDFKEVDIVDSQGLNFLIGLYMECEKRQIGLKITRCNSNNRKLFGIFKLDKMLGVQE